ncbi:MAG: OmpA family protein, partial [Bacteroidota bacterium]
TPDAQILYFTRLDHPRNQGKENAADVWLCNRLPDGSWGRALNAGSPINSFAADRILGISSDGRRLAVLRSGATQFIDLLAKGARSWRIVGSWPLAPGQTDYTTATFDLETQQLVFASTDYSGGDLFIQTALPGGEWSDPIALDFVNTDLNEQSPYLAPDGQSLYFQREDIWFLSRFSADIGAFGEGKELSGLLPSTVNEICFSVMKSEQAVVTLSDNKPKIYICNIPSSAQPVPSRLLEGNIRFAQAPSDRALGASIRLIVDGRERRLYPDKNGNYTLVIPTEGYARILAEAPGYFAPSRLLGGEMNSITGNYSGAEANATNLSTTYYEREAAIQQLHRNIANTRAEMAALQEERADLVDWLRSEQLAAGRDLLEGYTDPELDQLRYRLQKAQHQLTDTIPTGMQARGVPNTSEPPPTANNPTAFEELEAMKARYRAQQEALLRDQGDSNFEWRDDDPEEFRREVEKTVHEELVPEVSRQIASDALGKVEIDSLAMEQNIRQNLFQTSTPAVYERESWEQELIEDLRPDAEEQLRDRLRKPVVESLAEEIRIENEYDSRQFRLQTYQDSLDRALSAQQEEERIIYGAENSFTAKGGVQQPIAVPQHVSAMDLELVPLLPGNRIRLDQIQFDQNTAAFVPMAFAELDRLVDLLQQNPNLVVEISGHTGGQMGYLAAQDLSDRRAQAVAQYLYQKGINEERVAARGYGREQPLSGEHSTRNERIEILILQ